MLLKNYWAAGIALLSLTLTSCLNNVDPDAGKADENDATIKEYVTKNNLTDKAKPTTSGLYYYITAPVSNTAAKSPRLGEEVSFAYVLSLLNGQRVDSVTVTRPVQMPFGVGAVVPGLEEGLSLMKEGEKATLLLPYYLAFGNADRKDSTGRVTVPAYTPVRFDVQLLRSRSEDQQIEDYLATNPFGTNKVERFASGLRLVRNSATPGAGDALRGGQTVTVNYSGKLLRTGKEFDKNDKGTFRFTLNGNTIIPGFNEGILNMKKGEKATLLIPSTVAYGAQGSYNSSTGVYVIPPYAVLRFDVEVVDVQ
ncbi:FKBP-type peptidyl-prolyl cis-trans isomerase [Tellurirhabdus rosea]|uniref:FKBP-type peptidyl-prolyl cis-trans isomerase n=1 Tax=Tellurirhabdus rosea TaxID=2674997 RepID=UPI00224EEEFF|nr:FKBP-type peptidyl-prolyl cis-trans isomerase [Tellurirhabdus rosea]